MTDRNKDRSDSIIQWLGEHQLISRRALCKIVVYDVDNLRKCFDGPRSIPAKYLGAFEQELKKYGYIPPQ
jgi:hypothetical protein